MSKTNKQQSDDLEPGEIITTLLDIELSTMCDCKTTLSRLLPKGMLMMYIGTVRCDCNDQKRWVVDVFLTSDGIIGPHRVIDRLNPLISGQFKRSWMARVPK